MRKTGWGMALVFSLMASILAADPVEPARGTALRADLMDAIRPFAEYDLGAPVEFVVIELLVEDDLAFARVRAQRPGGGAIDMEATPLVTRRGVPSDLIDGPRIEAFLGRTAGRWHIVEYVVGSTDVWWFGYDCATYAAFQPEQACRRD